MNDETDIQINKEFVIYLLIGILSIAVVAQQTDISNIQSSFVGAAINQGNILTPTSTSIAVSGGADVSIYGELKYGAKYTFKPAPISANEQPAIKSYKTKVKSFPTMSELPQSPSTGDPTKDMINNLIPKGTPFYGQQAGVSFDDPVKSLTTWANYGKTIQLSGTDQERWSKIANGFTCDFCCGSPQNPTIITRCGCAHARAAQGIAKWMIKNYGDKYSDLEIYGEMVRWYVAWYPGPVIKRAIAEQQQVASLQG